MAVSLKQILSTINATELSEVSFNGDVDSLLMEMGIEEAVYA